MQVFSDANEWLQWRTFSGQEKRSLMTIGNFDGVHLGHQELLNAVVAKDPQNAHSVSVLLSFFPHPMQVLRPEKKHTRLFNLQDQQVQLQKRGLSAIVRQPFSREFSELSAEDFLQTYLLKYFHPRLLVVGHDFAFGAYRKGHLELLTAFCQKNQIELKVIPPLMNSQGKAISTSAIREALRQGELLLAEEMLGRKYYLQGIVEKGDQRGRGLGFPTANIRPDVDFYPKTGVYACQVSSSIFGDEKKPAVMNIGINRTFVEGDHNPIKVEVHLLNFSGDIYGRTLKVDFCQYLREEQKFESLEQLKKQISLDVEQAKAILVPQGKV